MLRSECPDPVDRELELDVDWLLRPERTVVVERGDARGGRHEVRATLFRNTVDEVHDRLLRGTVVPGRERVGRTDRPDGNYDAQDGNDLTKTSHGRTQHRRENPASPCE